MKMATDTDRKGQKRKNIDDPVQSSSGKEEEVEFDCTTETWMSDISFIVEGQRLYASKAILGLQSPVFRTMFGSNFSERNKKVVPLPGKYYDDFLQFLKCLLPNSSTEITKFNVQTILPLAEEYQVDVLKQKCERFLRDYVTKTWISTSYLIVLFQLAEKFNLQAVVDLIVEKLIDIDPRKIFESEEMSTTHVLQQKIIERLFECYKKHQMEVIKTHIDRDGAVNNPGFDEAQGVVATMSIERSECMVLLEKGEKVIAKSVLSLWNLKCMLSCTLLANINPDEKLSPRLQYALIIWKPGQSQDDRWGCQTKVKFSLKCRTSAAAIAMETKLRKVVSFSDSYQNLVLFTAEIVDFLKPSSKYVIDNKVKCELYVLANEPTTIRIH